MRGSTVGPYGLSAKARVKLLADAQRRLGISQVNKKLTWCAAARVMGRQAPITNEEGYALLQAFLSTGITVPAGEIVVRNLPEAKKSRKITKALTREKQRLVFAASDAFLQTYEWRRLRMLVLTKRGNRCECCGAKAPDVRINVDHIKTRRKYPELALVESNLQVLCEVCNHGKGSWDETDWRPSGKTQGMLKDSPVPETATATSTNSSCMLRLLRRSQEA